MVGVGPSHGTGASGEGAPRLQREGQQGQGMLAAIAGAEGVEQ